MKRREIEERLRISVEHITPDLKTDIIAKCKNSNKESVLFQLNGSKRRERMYRLIAIAAMLVLICNILLSGTALRRRNAVTTVVDIDVNPSIELLINSEDRVVAATPINADAERILEGMDLEGTQTKIAVNAILGSMVANGYLTGETNSILISVSSKKAGASDTIRADLSNEVGRMLNNYNSNASIVSQTICDDSEVENISKQYDISTGKASLVKQIVSCDNSKDAAELADMSITDLTKVAESVSTSGEFTIVEDVSANTIVINDISSEDESIIPVENAPMATNSSNGINANDDIIDKEVVSDNSASDNSISCNTASVNAISNNSISENSISDNSISVNMVSMNMAKNIEESDLEKER